MLWWGEHLSTNRLNEAVMWANRALRATPLGERARCWWRALSALQWGYAEQAGKAAKSVSLERFLVATDAQEIPRIRTAARRSRHERSVQTRRGRESGFGALVWMTRVLEDSAPALSTDLDRPLSGSLAPGESAPSVDDDTRLGVTDAEIARLCEAVVLGLLGEPDRRFVAYGTLRPGQRNHHRLRGVAGKWRPCTIYGSVRTTKEIPYFRWRPLGRAVDAEVLESDKLSTKWRELDAFEGPGYRRTLVPAKLRGEGRWIVGWVYESR